MAYDIWMLVKSEKDGSCVILCHPPAFYPTQAPPGWIVKDSKQAGPALSSEEAKKFIEQRMRDLCGSDKHC